MRNVSIVISSICQAFLTHHHYDHVGVENCGIGTMLLYSCIQRIVISTTTAEWMFIWKMEILSIWMVKRSGDPYTPGHTRGGVCYFSEKSKVGIHGRYDIQCRYRRTDFEDSSPDQMERSILDKINTWPNDIFIYPGHGDGCTMKKVRQINTEFLDVVKGEEK